VDVFVAYVNVEFTWDFDEDPDPFVDGVGGEIVLGGAHWIVAPCVFKHQAIPVLQRLDPLREPGKG
jgi:hypothetical protein